MISGKSVKVHIRHIEMSHTSMNISGGEKALIEIVRYLSKYQKIHQTIYTSETGQKLYSKLLGEHTKKIDFMTVGSEALERKNEYIAYFSRIYQQKKLASQFEKGEINIILTHEEFLPTSLLAAHLKKLNPHAYWLGIFHMKSPGIFHGFEGEYTKKLKFPSPAILRYKLEQHMFFILSKTKMDLIVSVTPIYKDYLIKKLGRNSYSLGIFGGESPVVIKKYSGVSINKSNEPRMYDLCYMGRFHPQKGVFELIDIIKRLKPQFPNIRIAVIGGGNKKYENKLKRLILQNDLESNFVLMGYISGDEKFEIVARSKIFIMPSYYESFGQVILEAMKLGLPIVAYDLPPYVVFEKGIIKSPILDNSSMASEINRLLVDKKYYTRISEDAKNCSSEFSWDKTGEEIRLLIAKLVSLNDKGNVSFKSAER